MGLCGLRSEQVAGAAKHGNLSRLQRLVQIGKVQRTAVPQYSPHFFEKDKFLIQRQGMQRKRADHFVE
jgi:hypothetical protein